MARRPDNSEYQTLISRRAAGEAEAAEKNFREPSDEHNRISSNVIAAAIAVHKVLGPGLLETHYEAAMAIELRARAMSFSRQAPLPVMYDDQCVGECRLDLVVEDKVVVELKAVDELRPVHHAQIRSYLRAGGFELGLLINFNVPRLVAGVRRVVMTV